MNTLVLLAVCLVILLCGYIFYGRWLVKQWGVGKGDIPTPAHTMEDGVDYVPMPAWRVFLIQFLNIAGLGPIFGAIMGVMFGPAAFLWIVFGTIFAGGVHDFVSAMIATALISSATATAAREIAFCRPLSGLTTAASTEDTGQFSWV